MTVEIVDRTGAPEFERSFDESRTEAELYHLGFHRVGATGISDDEHVDVDGVYSDEDQWFLERYGWVLTPVYGHPESGALVDVSRFHGNSLVVRFRTTLSDGSVAQSTLPWGRLPNLEGFAASLADASTLAAQLRGHGPRRGMSTRVVDVPGAMPLYEAHVEHVASFAEARGAQPLLDVSMDQYMRVQRHLMERQQTLMARSGVVALVMWLGGAATMVTTGLVGACAGGDLQMVLFAGLCVVAAVGWLRLAGRPCLLAARRMVGTLWMPRCAVPTADAG